MPKLLPRIAEFPSLVSTSLRPAVGLAVPMVPLPVGCAERSSAEHGHFSLRKGRLSRCAGPLFSRGYYARPYLPVEYGLPLSECMYLSRLAPERCRRCETTGGGTRGRRFGM